MTRQHVEPLVDPVALARLLDERLPGSGAGEPLEVERHRAGHSNETFFVRRGDERWVLRRPPRGAFLPTAHDVVREHRVLSALADTPVRAPRTVLLCEDPSVIGAPFYLMERVDGFVVREALPEALGEDLEARRRTGEEPLPTGCPRTSHRLVNRPSSTATTSWTTSCSPSGRSD